MGKTILAIDPGNERSAYVVYDSGTVIAFGIEDNTELIDKVNGLYFDFDECKHLAIEMIASYGMPVGATVFETCVWIGRFIQGWNANYTKVYRKDVKMHLCHSMKAKDSNIRQAIIDKYGGVNKAIGNKKCPKCKGKGWFGAGRPLCPVCNGAKWKYPPGPLCGIAEDVWAALGVAIVFQEKINKS